MLRAVTPHLGWEVLRQQNFLQTHTLVAVFFLSQTPPQALFDFISDSSSLQMTSTPQSSPTFTAISTQSACIHLSDGGTPTSRPHLCQWMELSPGCHLRDKLFDGNSYPLRYEGQMRTLRCLSCLVPCRQEGALHVSISVTGGVTGLGEAFIVKEEAFMPQFNFTTL